MMRRRRRAARWHRGRQDRWRQLYHDTRRAIRDAKRNTASTIEQHPPASSKFANGIRRVMGFINKNTKLDIFSGLSDLDVSVRIRDHFTTICRKYPPIQPTNLPSFLPDLPPEPIDELQLCRRLSSLKLGKASPPDDIDRRILKEFAPEFSKPLAHIFNICLRTGTFPDRWKLATITPLPKVKLVQELGELRPESPTPVLGKVLEKMVAEMVLADIRPNLDPRQYGNLKGCSTTHYLVYLLDCIMKGLDDLKPTIVSILLVDFKKAFDYVNHTVAITQLFLLGCRPNLLKFISNFLTGRCHRVRYQTSVSDYDDITCGVPQGTTLGIVVFLAVVDSLCRNVEERAKYVDDLTMLEIIKIRDRIVHLMQTYLDGLVQDCSDADVTTNPVKCECMHTCTAKRPLTYPDLHLNGTPLPLVQEVKLLGVYLNDELTWKTHIQHLVTKANKCVFILLRGKKFRFTIKSLHTMYQWYIRTGLEYAAPVWHSAWPNATRNPTT